MPTPGTYREADHAAVPFAEAMDTWELIAYDFLVDVARNYNRWTTYGELTEHVQTVSGIRTRMRHGHWVGRLLTRVADRADADGDVPLASLCVRADGRIGDGYGRDAGLAIVGDVDELAAKHRLLCYQKYAENLPRGGGEPTLTWPRLNRRPQ